MAAFELLATRGPSDRLRLVVGVTGHRLHHFDAETRPRIRSAIGQAVEAITQAFQARGQGQLRLVSSLASGADSMAADAALERGWTLDAVLPVARDAYAEDFSGPGELADYRRQIASAGAVFELPGPKVQGAHHGAHYERAGRVVLDQCDILLAVWDGHPARGRGGTEQIMSEAIERHIPVLLIDADGAQPPEILWTGFDEHGLKRKQLELIGRRRLDALPGLLGQIIGGPGETGMSDPGVVRPGPNLAVAFPLLLACAGVRGLRRSDLIRPGSEAARRDLVESHGDVCAGAGPFGHRLEDLLADYAATDAAATHMAQLYRSSFVANFAMASIAVLLALAGLMLPPVIRPVLTLGEVLVVVAILWLTHMARKKGWHGRWITGRHIAERLRCMIVAAQLGDLNVQIGDSVGGGRIGRQLRESARALGLPTLRVDGAYLARVQGKLLALLDDQIAYHRRAGGMMHTLDHRLHRLGTVLFSLSALSSVGVLAFEIARRMSHDTGMDEAAHPLDLATTVLSAALPAIGGAIYGIRMQGDFSGASGRSFDLAEALRRLKHAVENEISPDDGLFFDHLRHEIRHATEIMGSELTDWRAAQQARPLTLPG